MESVAVKCHFSYNFQTGLRDPENQNGHKQPKNCRIFKDLQFYHRSIWGFSSAATALIWRELQNGN